MFETPRQFVVQNVLPNYRAFFDHRREGAWGQSQLLRLAINACVALYHLREHLPTRPTDHALEARCPDYALVRDITNVAKHRKLTQGTPRISTAEQLTEFLTSTQYTDTDGDYWCPRVDVEVRLDDGSVRDLAEIIHGVMVMWCHELDRLGIIALRLPTDDITDMHVPRAEAASRRSALQLTAGEAAKLQIRMRRFDYTANASQPLDLTGCKVEMVFYAPPKSVPIQLRLSKEGFPDVAVDYDVPLSEAQGLEYMRLRGDREQENRFVHGLLTTTPALAAGLSAAVRKAFEEAKLVTDS